jgi:hypothetical protein
MKMKKTMEAEELRRIILDVKVKGRAMTPRTKQKLEAEGISLRKPKRQPSLKSLNEYLPTMN